MIETRIEAAAVPEDLRPAQIASEFRALLERGVELRVDGNVRDDPGALLRRGYAPKYKVELFDATFYLGKLREDENFRFFVGYVRLGSRRTLHPRIFYKDSSLVWRTATHVIRTEDENWIGKGDVKPQIVDGEELLVSAEETTNLPIEIQAAFDDVSRRGGRVRRDLKAVQMVLRDAPPDRLEPYRDFAEPRRRAMADPANQIHGNREIARFTRQGDPHSLKIVKGYEPDFTRGLLEESELRSNLYGGDIRKFRILSKNRKIQYQFVAAPRIVWIIPPQPLTVELNSYGVRTVDVFADEDVFVPGYEYHYMDDSHDPPELHSQIPKGYAGPASTVDPARADASPWIDELSIVKEFRRRVLRR